MTGIKIFFILIMIPLVAAAQKISIMDDSIRVSSLFNRIEQQTDYTIAYNHSSINDAKMLVLPKTFRNTNLKNALEFALRATNCIHIIKGKHIIVLPDYRKINAGRAELSDESGDGDVKFSFRGLVVDGQTGELLQYASVQLLDKDGESFALCASDGNGMFSIATKKAPAAIKISFIGYQTMTEKLNLSREDLGLFALEAAEYSIDGIVVAAGKHKIDRSVYEVSPQMRHAATNARELLDFVHDLRYDIASSAIRAGGNASILLLVNGTKQSYDYISNLSPSRIRSIEVIYEASDRFLSENCETMINFVLDDSDNAAYNLFVSNATALNISDKLNRIAMERPSAGVAYGNGKANLYATYSFKSDRWKMPLHKEVKRNGKIFYRSNDMDDIYSSHSHNITAGLSYSIKPEAEISLQNETAVGAMFSEYAYNGASGMMNNPSQAANVTRNATQNLASDRISVTTLAWRQKINNRLRLAAEATYNYYYNDIESRFGITSNANNYYSEDDLFNEYKNQAVLNFDARYITELVVLDAGYSGSWRQYASLSSHGKGFLDYNEYRNAAFAYLSFNLNRSMRMKSGLLVETTAIDNRGERKNLLRVYPYIQLNWEADGKNEVSLSYIAASVNPVLYQISPMSITVDTFIRQIGNPRLYPSVSHTLALRMRLADRLTFSSSYRYTVDGISEAYAEKEYRLYRTFANANIREMDFRAAYGQALGRFFSFKAGITYYRQAIVDRLDGWIADAEAKFYAQDINLGVNLGYYRNMKRNIILNGYRSTGRDNWALSITKTFMQQSLSISMTYIPPLTLGIRKEQKKEVNTAIYSERSALDVGTFNNMLLINLNFRINGSDLGRGKIKASGEKEEERQRRRME